MQCTFDCMSFEIFKNKIPGGEQDKSVENYGCQSLLLVLNYVCFARLQ